MRGPLICIGSFGTSLLLPQVAYSSHARPKGTFIFGVRVDGEGATAPKTDIVRSWLNGSKGRGSNPDNCVDVVYGWLPNLNRVIAPSFDLAGRERQKFSPTFGSFLLYHLSVWLLSVQSFYHALTNQPTSGHIWSYKCRLRPLSQNCPSNPAARRDG